MEGTTLWALALILQATSAWPAWLGGGKVVASATDVQERRPALLRPNELTEASFEDMRAVVAQYDASRVGVLNPCTELVVGRCNSMVGEAVMRMAFEIMNCQRADVGLAAYPCGSDTDFRRDCLRAIRDDSGARSSYTFHEGKIADYCEQAQPRFLQQQMMETLINLGSVSVKQLRLQYSSHRMASELLQHQEGLRDNIQGVANTASAVLSNQEKHIALAKTLGSEIANVRATATETLAKQQGLAEAQKLLAAGQESVREATYNLLDRAEQSVAAQKLLLSGQAAHSKRLAEAKGELTAVSTTLESVALAGARAAEQQRALLSAQSLHRQSIGLVQNAVQNVSFDVQRAIDQHVELLRGQERARDLANQTAGYLDRALTVLQKLSLAVSAQKGALAGLSAAFATVELWLFLVGSGALLTALTSVKSTQAARFHVVLVCIAYWFTGDLLFLPVWVSRTLFITLALLIVARHYVYYRDAGTLVAQYMAAVDKQARQDAEFMAKNKLQPRDQTVGQMATPAQTLTQACLASITSLHAKMDEERSSRTNNGAGPGWRRHTLRYRARGGDVNAVEEPWSQEIQTGETRAVLQLSLSGDAKDDTAWGDVFQSLSNTLSEKWPPVAGKKRSRSDGASSSSSGAPTIGRTGNGSAGSSASTAPGSGEQQSKGADSNVRSRKKRRRTS